ncbi:MAG: TonB-dependent receptor [Candidatus Aminicenantes bacterium]|nr:TonB-dependent receptor [Candidatus Aminicenantes bacterium]
MRRTIISMVAISTALLLMGSMSYAQIRTGTITGTVTDTDGVILPGATVGLSGEKLLGGVRSIVTNEKGKFRFPNLMPGEYELTVTLAGFQTAKISELRVNVAGTVTVDVILKQATLDVSVTVLAESPVVDVAKSVVSTNITSELMEVLPMRRFTFFDYVGTTPGVTTGGDRTNNWQSAMGSGDMENTYYFEGVETTNPENAGSWLWANPDQIEEIDVIVSGAPAEYGNFQGMVVNLVSKTGSNTFQGSINFYQRWNWLTGNNTPEEEFPYYRDKYLELTGTFGGYLIKDKLWFFLAGQLMTDRSVGVGADPAFGVGDYHLNTQFVRLDWQINKNNKFTVSNDTNWYQGNGTPSEFTPYECVWAEHSWNPLPSATWTSILSTDTFFEIKYSGWWVTPLYAEAADGDKVTPYHWDAATGMESGNYWYWGEWTTGQHQIQGTVTHYAEDFLLGDHEFKFGAIYNHGWADWKWGYCSGVWYYDWDGYPYFAYYMDPEEYGGVTNRISSFLDDSWTVSDRLTLNLGIRFDHVRGGFPEYDLLDRFGNPTGEKTAANMDLIKWDTFSPRLGIVFQLTGDRKTILKASYGRYYSHLLIRSFYANAPSHTDRYIYEYNWDTLAFDILWEHTDPLANIGIDPNLKNPYSDQYSVGIEREIFPEFSLSLTGIYKESKNMIATLNTGAVYETIDYYDEFGNQHIQVFNQTNSYEDNFFLTTNPGDHSNYKAIILAFRKRLSHNWQVNGSLTLAKARDYPVGYSDKNSLINRYGVAGYFDREYQFKMSGTYIFPYGIMITAYFSHEQGRAFNRTVRVPLDQGRQTVAAEEPGSQRYPDQTFLDLRVEKEFRLWKTTRLKLLIDVWNLLNNDANQRVASTNAASDAYLAPTSYDLPRRAQIGIRFVF